MFGEAVQYAVAIRYLNDALNSIGLNTSISSAQNRERFEQMKIDYEGALYGGMIEGLGYKKGIMDHLSIDFSNLDAVCFKDKKDKVTKVKF
jgi:hypothetical protein